MLTAFFMGSGRFFTVSIQLRPRTLRHGIAYASKGRRTNLWTRWVCSDICQRLITIMGTKFDGRMKAAVHRLFSSQQEGSLVKERILV